MKVTIVGLGPVGQVAAAGLAKAGHDVLGVDINRQRVSALQSGDTPIFEPGLNELIRETSSGGKLRFLHNDDVAESLGDVVLIATGTPPGVGMGMKPEPVWLKPGDVVELGISGLGQQRQTVVPSPNG